MDAYLRKMVTECIRCFQNGRNLKTKQPKTEKDKLKNPSQPNEGLHLYFHGQKKTIITCDASTSRLGATLQQIDPEGNGKIIAYASRFLNTAEQKYAINEMELLSVVWSCEHFKYYIYEKESKSEPDHKALVPILTGNRETKPYNSHLTRWVQRLMLSDFDISYRPGNTMGITDYLSQPPAFEAQKPWSYEEKFVVNPIKEVNRKFRTR